jgi:hypothetical protein
VRARHRSHHAYTTLLHDPCLLAVESRVCRIRLKKINGFAATDPTFLLLESNRGFAVTVPILAVESRVCRVHLNRGFAATVPTLDVKSLVCHDRSYPCLPHSFRGFAATVPTLGVNLRGCRDHSSVVCHFCFAGLLRPFLLLASNCGFAATVPTLAVESRVCRIRFELWGLLHPFLPLSLNHGFATSGPTLAVESRVCCVSSCPYRRTAGFAASVTTLVVKLRGFLQPFLPSLTSQSRALQDGGETIGLLLYYLNKKLG